jgi:hypothetical protein
VPEHSRRSGAKLSDTDAEIESLRDRRKQVLLRANERFARAAIKAGLAELTIPDDALDAAFEEIAARFRKISVAAGSNHIGGLATCPKPKKEELRER